MIPAIGSRSVFEDLRTTGVRVHAPPVHAKVLPAASMQLGFAIPRGFGNAVERNRCRRRLRAAAVSALESTPPFHNVAMLVGARRAALLSPYPDLVRAFEKVIHSLDETPSGTAGAGR